MNSLFVGTFAHTVETHQNHCENRCGHHGLFKRLIVGMVAVATGLLFMSNAAAQEAIIPDGAGTIESPYLITCVENLVWIGDEATTDTPNATAGVYYMMINDIDSSATIHWPNGFPPIGTVERPFEGYFLGGGYVIRDMTLKADQNLGVFGVTSRDAQIANVGLENVTVSLVIQTNGTAVGSLVGLNNGIVYNSYAIGTCTVGSSVGSVGGLIGISGTSAIVSDTSTSMVMQSDKYVGGLIGTNNGKIMKSFVTKAVTGGMAGGLVGYSDGSIENCYSMSKVTGVSLAGGLVSELTANATVTNCYSCGAVTCDVAAGGLIGLAVADSVTDSFWDYDTSTQLISDGGTGCRTAQMKKVATYSDWDLKTIWFPPYPSVNNGYPTLRMMGAAEKETYELITKVVPESYGTITVLVGAEEAAGPFVAGTTVTLVANPVSTDVKILRWEGDVTESEEGPTEEGPTTVTIVMNSDSLVTLYLYKSITNVEELQAVTNDLNGYFIVANDIDCAGTTTFTAIGKKTSPFTGTFNGNGKTISNLTIDNDSADYQGLFGGIGTDAVVEKFTLDTPTITGQNYVGALAGYATACELSEITVKTGTVTGMSTVGGIVGLLDGTALVTAAKFTGDVSGTTIIGGAYGQTNEETIILGASVASSSKVSATDMASYAGGLVGKNAGSMPNGATSAATVTGRNYVGGFAGYNTAKYLLNSVATGAVTGYDYVGGLIAYNDSLMITASSASGAVTGTDYVGGFIGYNVSGDMENVHALGVVDGFANYIGGLIGLNGSGSITAGYATGAVSGDQYVGGLIGQNRATLTNCYATGDVDAEEYAGGLVGDNLGAVDAAYATGYVDADMYLGGLLGRNVGAVSVAAAFGDVTGDDFVGGLIGIHSTGAIADAYAMGSPWGKNYVGGLIGDSSNATITRTFAAGRMGNGGMYSGGLIGHEASGTVTDSYWSIDGTGKEVSAAGEGLEARTMYKKETYSGWDFDSTWGISENKCYPYLSIYPTPFVLRTKVEGNGNITITGPPTTKYEPGLTLTLTANTQNNSVFRYWRGDVSDPTSTTTYILTNNHKNATAHFSSSYDIYTLEELRDLPVADLDGIYNLMADIDASETSSWNGGAGFIPIGTDDDPFTGIFNGNGHKISNLTIARGDESNVGLFGCVDANGEINDLTLISPTVTGAYYVGALVGLMGNGSVSNSTVTNVTVTGSFNYNTVSQFSSIGGLIGCNYGTLSNVSSSGTVNALDNYSYVGGLIGFDAGYILTATSKCAVGGSLKENYVGGLCGYEGGQATAVTANGDVIGGYYVGGLMGAVGTPAVIENGRATGNVSTLADISSGETYIKVGGLVGDNAGFVKNSVAGSMVMNGSVQGYTGGFAGENFGAIEGSWCNGETAGQSYTGGFVGINKGSIERCHSASELNSGMTQDENWIGGFVGYNDGSIASCYATENIFGADYAGGFVGSNDGSISSCAALGNVIGENNIGGFAGSNGGTIMTSFATGLIDAYTYVGGFVGINEELAGISNCYATGLVQGQSYVGGFAGQNGANAFVLNTYSSGKVKAVTNDVALAGGFMGSNLGTVNNGYWDVTTSAWHTSHGGKGIDTATMKKQASFVNWDFSSVWGIQEKLSYPYLQAQILPTTVSRFILNYDIIGPGTVTITPDQTDYKAGTKVTLTAVADNEAAVAFVCWQGTDEDSYVTTSTSVLMTANRNIIVRFAEITDISSTASFINDLKPTKDNSYSYYRLTKDLDFGSTPLTPIGSFSLPFNSVLDGNGKTITNISVLEPGMTDSGIFAVVGPNAYIHDLAIKNATVIGESETGILAGMNEGLVERVSCEGNVSAVSKAGGMVGVNHGTLQDVYAMGNVNGDVQSGGLVGYNYGTITNGYAAVAMDGNSKAGLVGTLQLATSDVTHSYWDVEVAASTESAAGEGKTTKAMKANETYVDWDFTNIWGRSDSVNSGYPFLFALEDIGYAQVYLEPEEARADGARWIMDGTEYESGDLVAIPASVVRTITFKDLTAWKTPSSQGVIVSKGQTKSWTRTYIKQYGAVRVLLSPAQACASGARWYMDGAEHKTGDTVYNLIPGTTHTITFKTIPGFTAPESQDVVVVANTVTVCNGVYTVLETGNVRIYLTPAAAIQDGAKWRIDGGDWIDSGTFTRFITTGIHSIDFKTIDGWETPADQTIFVETGKTVSLTVPYTKMLDLVLLDSDFTEGVSTPVAAGSKLDLTWNLSASKDIDDFFWGEVFASKTGGFDQVRFGTAITSSYKIPGANEGEQVVDPAGLTMKALPDGRYTLMSSINRASINGCLNEYDYTNNWMPIAGKRLSFYNPDLPDCDLEMLETIAYEKDPNDPKKVTITGTIRNNGPSDLNKSGAWIEGFYGTMTAEAKIMIQGTICSGILVKNLKAGETYDFTMVGYVPAGVDNRGILVMVDSTDIVPETNEANNNCGILYDPLIVPAPSENGVDLTIIDFHVSADQLAPNQVKPGDKLMYEVTVLNKGTTAITSDVWLEVFASQNGGNSLVGGSTAVWSKKITPPGIGESKTYLLEQTVNAIGDGMYSLVAIVNRMNVTGNVGDITPFDNYMTCSDGRISLSTPVDDASDVNLVWSAGPFFTQSGNKMTVTGTIKNVGTTASGSFWTEVYTGTVQNKTGYYFRDRVIAGGVKCNGLAAGATKDISITGSVETGKVIGALIDSTDLVPETDETDNYDYSDIVM